MKKSTLCGTCGRNPSHPCYLFQCEDCWVEAQISRSPKPRRKYQHHDFRDQTENAIQLFEKLVHKGRSRRKFA